MRTVMVLRTGLAVLLLSTALKQALQLYSVGRCAPTTELICTELICQLATWFSGLRESDCCQSFDMRERGMAPTRQGCAAAAACFARASVTMSLARNQIRFAVPKESGFSLKHVRPAAAN